MSFPENDYHEDKEAQNNRKPQNRRTKKVPRKISERYLRNSGLFYLQRFTASSGHFKTVMTRKIKKSCYHHKEQNFDECVALLDKITTEFIDQGYIDDSGYLRGMVTSLRRSGKSKKAIMAKLMQKQVSAEDIEAALQKYDEENYEAILSPDYDAEFEAAKQFARKKRLGPYDEREKYDDQKALAMFARNGFGFDTAKRVLALENLD